MTTKVCPECGEACFGAKCLPCWHKEKGYSLDTWAVTEVRRYQKEIIRINTEAAYMIGIAQREKPPRPPAVDLPEKRREQLLRALRALKTEDARDALFWLRGHVGKGTP